MIETMTRPAPTEVVSPLKLSEALRLGAMNTRQAFSVMADGKGRYCAIGTIWLAMGYDVDPEQGASDGPYEVFKVPFDFRLFSQPGCGNRECVSAGDNVGGDDLFSMVMHLNDQHQLPRERIADLLEGAGL